MKREPLNKYNFVEKDYNRGIAYVIYINRKQEEFRCIVDLEILDKIKPYPWRHSTGYFLTGNGKETKTTLLHRFIMLDDYDDKEFIVDHIDGVRSNCLRENLRVTSQLRNVGNRNIKNSKRNKSGFIGITYNSKRKKYEPEIKFNYKKIHLSRYSNLNEAVYARYVAECVLFKKYRSKQNNSSIYKQIKTLTKERRDEIKNYVANKCYEKCELTGGLNYYDANK